MLAVKTEVEDDADSVVELDDIADELEESPEVELSAVLVVVSDDETANCDELVVISAVVVVVSGEDSTDWTALEVTSGAPLEVEDEEASVDWVDVSLLITVLLASELEESGSVVVNVAELVVEPLSLVVVVVISTVLVDSADCEVDSGVDAGVAALVVVELSAAIVNPGPGSASSALVPLITFGPGSGKMRFRLAIVVHPLPILHSNISGSSSIEVCRFE